MTSTRFSQLDFSSGLAWLSVSKGCENKGNLIIEHALRKMLNIRGPTIQVSAFLELSEQIIARINSCRLLVLPGSTLLDADEHLALNKLDRITCNKLAIGVAFCTSTGNVSLKVARNIDLPIGSRDPFTNRRLRMCGIKSYLVGCPTLFLNRATRWRQKPGPIIISLGPGRQRLLQECVRACAAFDNVILVEHVPRLQPRFPLPDSIRRLELKSAPQAIELYSKAAAVLTGRIHGYLTCISLGVPVTFFSSSYDSRFSLLQYLGTPIHSPDPDKITAAVDLMLEGNELSTRCFEQAEKLRVAMANYLNRFGVSVT